MPRTDVLVVGAGPAGATAAYHAARSGLSALLIDRKRFPRSKVCGDGLTPRALRALDRMGVADDALVSSRIVGVRLVGQGRSTRYSLSNAPAPFNFAAVVPRVVLDERIRRAAESAGAEFLSGRTAVDFYTDGVGQVRGVWVDGPLGRELLEAKLTIVADGAAGRLGRQLRGDMPGGKYSAFALRQYWSNVCDLEPLFEFHMPLRWHGQALLGYAWVFPLSTTCANVGVGVLAEHAHSDQARLPEVLAGFVDEALRRDPRFAAATALGPVEAGPINSRMADPKRTPAGALLVGDAAGLVNGFTAEGIAYALESGELAGRTAARMLPRQRLPTAAYARALVGAFPRHWATRESSRHHRWLMALGPQVFGAPEPTELVRALRQVLLDESLDAPSVREARSRAAHWLLRSTQHRAVDVVRSTDRLLAEIVDVLLADSTSVAMVPLTFASTIASDAHADGGVLVDGLAAITLLSLAQSLLDEVHPTTEREGDVVSAAAIVVADCITTEAIAVLSRLPDATYRRVSNAFREAASARFVLALDRTVSEVSDARYVSLAAPTRCAAMLALEAAYPLDLTTAETETAPFATWYVTVRLATADLRRLGTRELTAYLGAAVARPPAPPAYLRSALQHLALPALREARVILDSKILRVPAATAL